MTEKEFRKLKRRDMLEIMLAQSREIDRLKKELTDVKAKLADKEIRINRTGSIAEASLAVTNIFEEAQKAAETYLDNLYRRYPEGEGGDANE